VPRTMVLLVIVLVLSGVAPRAVAAALGDDVATVETDRAHLRSALRVTRAARYDVHELSGPTGTVVREYVSPDGRVFGVAWEGPWPPDLRQILGRYFDRFTAHVPSRRRGRRPLVVDEPDLVVVWSGHPRAFNGRAYVRSLLPAGIDAAIIR